MGNRMHPVEMKRMLLILLISCCVLVIIIFWQQMGGKPNIVIPHIVMKTVRKIYSPPEDSGEPRWSWKCVQQRCERMEYNGNGPIMSQATCGMLCGSTQLWPQPTGPVTLGTKTVTFLHQHVHFETSAEEPVRSLLQKSYAVFNENIACMVHQSEYWLQKSDIDRLLIKVKVLHSDQAYLFLDTDEGYNLTVKSGVGSKLVASTSAPENILVVSITASTFFGARHGLETLSQLIWWDEYATPNGGMLKTLRNANVIDRPKFPYRGLMLDTARNYFPIEDIRRTIDGMSAAKLNVFHWHITDSQSFPLKLPSVPQLSLHGAYSSSMVYEPSEVKDLVEYARVRGIRVIVEVDTPAHAGNGWQWGPDEGLGELAVCINERPWNMYCGEPPCGQLNPHNPHVYDLLEKIYGDLMDMGSDQEIYHLGGDEVNTDCWFQTLVSRKSNEQQKPPYNYTDMNDLWGDFTIKTLGRLESARDNKERRSTRKSRRGNKSDKLENVILWSSNLSKRPYLQKYLDKDKIIVQSWGASQWPDTQDLLADGYRVLLSHVDAWYLDCGFGRWRETGEAACDPYRPWQTMYTHRPWVQLQQQVKKQIQQQQTISDPLPNFDVKKQIIGGEVCLWSEQLDAASLDTRIWPRAAAFAERVWSDPSGQQQQQDGYIPMPYEDTSVLEDVYTRLSTHRERLVNRKIGAEAMWPRWCSNNPGMCL